MNEILTCRIVTEGSLSVVHLDGDLDGQSAKDLFAQLEPIVMSGGDLVVDLSALSFVDTSGLDYLERLARYVAHRGGSLCLANPSAPVRRLLDITGSSARFRVRSGGALPSA